jgi:hypothetical protein
VFHLKCKESDMGFAFFTVSGLLRPLRPLVRRLLGRRASADPQACAFSARGLQTTAGRAHVAWPPAAHVPQRPRPLRVLRVVDAGHAPSSAGRMVICGSIADVCAELDRMVAQEAAAA